MLKFTAKRLHPAMEVCSDFLCSTSLWHWSSCQAYRAYFSLCDFEVCDLLRLNNVKLHNTRASLLTSYFKLLVI